jgi:4-hydroxy-tetrahydrodipicolinate reductase
MSDMKIGIVGCAGRMGRMLIRIVGETEGAELAGGTERPGSEHVGADLGTLVGLPLLGIRAGEDADALFGTCDAVLDFTTPKASLAHAKIAARHRKIHVVGTTGMGNDDVAALRRAAAETAIVFAPNMSLGVNLLLALVERAAHSLDAGWDIEIVEMHHRMKVDAPSGTALALGRAAAKGRAVALDEVAVKTRDGVTGAREAGTIGFATLRGGDVVGEHRVILAADGERIELGHVATDRAIFARGAVRAALWAKGKPAGLYAMKDVLGL